MRLFDEVVARRRHGRRLGRRCLVGRGDRACAAAAGCELLTVGTAGETLRLVAREPRQLGQTLTIEAEGAPHGQAAADRRLPGRQRAGRGGAGASRPAASRRRRSQRWRACSRCAGRLERAAITRAGAPVYVDYAHTPDALEAAIAALRPHTKGRLIVVFGAGGDRDQGKRPEMGAVAARMPTSSIVTDDNPRGEDPAAIRARGARRARPARARSAIGARPSPPPWPKRGAATSS